MSSSDFEEDADTLEGGEQQRGGEPGAKPAWECPGEGCVRRLEIGDEFGNKKWPTYKAKQDGTFWPAPSWWWYDLVISSPSSFLFKTGYPVFALTPAAVMMLLCLP